MDETPLTPKAEQTRQKIFDTGVRLFTEKGYEETTMREIAAEAGYSLGLAYRYFASKEDFVIALYRRNAALSQERAENLPRGTISMRFHEVMRGMLEDVTPHREAYIGVLSSAMNPRSKVGVLSDYTADIRDNTRAAFRLVVTGASDAPKAPQAEQLSSLLYSAHFLVLLFWVNDKTPNCQATAQLLDFSRDTLNLVRPALILPPVARSMARVAGIVQTIFGGSGS